MALQRGFIKKPRHYFRIHFRIHYFFNKKQYFKDGWCDDSALSAVNSSQQWPSALCFSLGLEDPVGSWFEHTSSVQWGGLGDKLPGIHGILRNACQDLRRKAKQSYPSDVANAGALQPKQALLLGTASTGFLSGLNSALIVLN